MKLIGEIGINANGDIKLAKELINMAKGCGCWAVKFQKRVVDKVYAKTLDKPRESPWGNTEGEQKHGLEFSFEDYQQINYHCKMIGIPWFASAWDAKSLDFLEYFNPPFHKVASPIITHLPLVRAIASLGRPTFVSTGACKLENILAAYDIFCDAKSELILMHCVIEYPVENKDCNAKMVQTLQGMFPRITVGYSGHERGTEASLAAVVFGAEYIERHITLDHERYGSDQKASLKASQLASLVEEAKVFEEVIGDGKKTITPKEAVNAKKMRYFE